MSCIILAMDKNGGIGSAGKLPWPNTGQYRKDLNFFSKTTVGNAVIMGWNTYLSIGTSLKNRYNIIITKTIQHEKTTSNISFCNNIFEAVELGKKYEKNTGNRCFIIGGGKIYQQYMQWYNPSEIYYSRFDESFECDTYAPTKLQQLCSNLGVGNIKVMDNHEENNYLDLFRKVLKFGHVKNDRTGTGTITLFSPGQLEFSLDDYNIPVLTTKRVALKTGVIPELLWFLSGKTDTRILEQQGCNIWKDNTSQDFLQKRGLRWKEKDLGPGYGFQWRHCGAEYDGMDKDYTGKGKDQITYIIDTLKKDPDSRRIILSSWIPSALDDMALPPCHILYQLYSYIDHHGQRCLEAHMYQRSADSFLGVPFNISSYSLLTHIIAEITGMKATRIVFSYGDYHIYQNHLDQVKIQIQRNPYPFPKIRFNRDIKDTSIYEVKHDDFSIIGYMPHNKIKAKMAI
jgi:thymidylate synthase